MNLTIFALAIIGALVISSDATAQDKPVEKPVVMMITTLGVIEITLEPEFAPKTVENFIAYIESGKYDGTIFHRVISGFMIQGGGFTEDLNKVGDLLPPITNEATRRFTNARGTISMARTSAVHSATNQFFINHKDNDNLDHKDSSIKNYGYCAFGTVTMGLDIVDKIAEVRTKAINQGFMNLPVEPVVIEKMWVK